MTEWGTSASSALPGRRSRGEHDFGQGEQDAPTGEVGEPVGLDGRVDGPDGVDDEGDRVASACQPVDDAADAVVGGDPIDDKGRAAGCLGVSAEQLGGVGAAEQV